MTTLVIGGYSGTEKFDVRIVDTIINDHSYVKNVYHSFDQQENWTLVYKISVTKIE